MSTYLQLSDYVPTLLTAGIIGVVLFLISYWISIRNSMGETKE